MSERDGPASKQIQSGADADRKWQPCESALAHAVALSVP